MASKSPSDGDQAPRPGTRLRIVMYTEGLPFTGETLTTQALGGAESAFIYLAREFVGRGHQVTAVCRCPAPGTYGGVDYHDLVELTEILQRPADLFLCSRYFNVFNQPVAASVKFLWTHDNLVPDRVPKLKKTLQLVDGLYALSAFHRQQFVQAIPELAEKVGLIHNGVDLELIDSIVETAVKKHRIMFTSRPERGLWDALDIYESIDDRTLELIVCTYAGLPHGEVAAVERRCNGRIAELREQGFPITTGAYSKPELYGLLAESKAVIYPTRCSEIFCLSAIEAQACGTVFLTTDRSALAENVPYRRFETGDKSGLAEELAFLLANEPTRQVLEQRVRAFARSFSWSRVADRIVADTRALLSRHDRAPAPVMAKKRIVPPKSNSLPMISCLTVTYDRLRRLKRAIDCYCRQTYVNRELVILTDGPQRCRRAIQRYIQGLDRDDLRLVEIDEPNLRLGALRNRAIEAARGEVVCQWDDDDWHHPQRLEQQTARLLETGTWACFLKDHLHFWRPSRRLYWIDGSQPENSRGWIPPTLMMFRDPELRYPNDPSHEEAPSLATHLFQHDVASTLARAGHLYVYTYHGANTHDEQHRKLIASRNRLDLAFLRESRHVLEAALRHYGLPRPIKVFARTGHAFDLS